MKQIQCSNCHGFKLRRQISGNPLVAAFQVIAAFGFVLTVLGIFVWPLFFVGLVLWFAGVLLYLPAMFLWDKDPKYKCRSCGYVSYPSRK